MKLEFQVFGQKTNWLTLRFFDRRLDQEFRLYNITRHLWQLRLAHLLALVFYVMAVTLENYVIGFDAQFYWGRIAIVGSSFILGYLITFVFKDFYKKYYQWFDVYYVVLTGASFILFGALAPDPYRYTLFSGLLISLIFNYTFIQQSFIKAAITGTILWLIYCYASVFLSGFEKHLLHLYIYVSVANFLGMFIAYLIELDSKRAFLLQRRIERDSKRILKVNEELEIKVEERTRELLASMQAAEKGERLKTAFLGNMSHEIRTPMNGILGFADLLKDSELTEEKRIFYLDIILKSGNRMLETLNNLLEYAKIEAGAMVRNLSSIQVSFLLEEIASFFQPEAEKKGLRLVYLKSEEYQELYVESDNQKLHSILNNLVKNAIKYTNEGSIEIACEIVQDYLVFQVRDTGIGVSKLDSEVIFDRFTQANPLNIRVSEGAGLGLTISKYYAHLLEAELWIEPNQPRGSIFYLRHPRNLVKPIQP